MTVYIINCDCVVPITLYILEPFEVGFVQTSYTVSESDGSVEVCVQLTRPQIDIFDEFVVVEVTDFPSSVYIPLNAALASEFLNCFLDFFRNSIFLEHLVIEYRADRCLFTVH